MVALPARRMIQRAASRPAFNIQNRSYRRGTSSVIRSILCVVNNEEVSQSHNQSSTRSQRDDLPIVECFTSSCHSNGDDHNASQGAYMHIELVIRSSKVGRGQHLLHPTRQCMGTQDKYLASTSSKKDPTP